MKKKKRLRTALLILALLLFSGCSDNGNADTDDSGLAQTQNIALWSTEINTTDLAGESVTQEDFKDNSLTVMNFWATWCSPCVRELPELQEVSEYYKDKDVEVVGVLHDGATDFLERDEIAITDARILMDDAAANYRVIIPDETLWTHLGEQVMALPTTFFIDAEGNVVKVVVNAHTADEWKVMIDDVLKQTT